MDNEELVVVKKTWWRRFLLRFKEPYIAWGMICGFIASNMSRNFKWPYLYDYLLGLCGG